MVLEMNHPHITIVLLAIAIALAVVCSIGLAVMRDAYQRLQFGSPVTTLSMWLILAAVWLEENQWQPRLKSALIALILLVMNGVLSHVTARAIRIRDEGHWPLKEEPVPLMTKDGPVGHAAEEVQKP